MANYDLSMEIGQFLDHHLMLKVLDFLDEQKAPHPAFDRPSPSQ